MAMTPQEQQEFNELKRQVAALVAVQDLTFIKNVERRLTIAGITSETPIAATTITQAVRNVADTGAQDVAKVFDAKVPIYLSDGSARFIGVYNS